MILKLLEKKAEAEDAISFLFEPQGPLVWQAGQFIHYVLHHRPTDDRGSDRWFTNAGAPFEKIVRITTRITQNEGSTFKKKLQSLQIGKSIEISYVEGDFVIDDLEKEYVLIAGGIGITPFRSILAQLAYEKKQIHATLLYANKDNNIVYKKELESFSKENPYFTIHYIFSPEHIDSVKIKELVPDFSKKTFYISGPEPMVDSLGEVLKKIGLSDEQIKQDWFPGYPAF